MPRDKDKDNAPPRGRRDRPAGGKDGRSGKPRGPEKKFAKRGFAGKSDRGDGDKRPYAGKRDGDAPRRSYGDAPRPARFNRDDRPARGGDRPDRQSERADRGPRKDFRPREGGGEKRPFTPRGDGPRGERPRFNRDERAPRGDRGEARPAGRFTDKKFGEKRPYTPRGEGFRKDGDRQQRARPQGDRPYSPRPPREGDGEKRPYTPRGERSFGDKKFSRGAPDRGSRGPRKDFGDREFRGRDRSDDKPWQKRDARGRDDARRDDRPRRETRNFDKPRDDRGDAERPRFARPRDDRSDRGDRAPRRFDRPREDRPQFDRPRGDRSTWQERPRRDDRDDRPRRDNEDDSKIFAKRPAFGGRGAYRERRPDDDRRSVRAEPKPKKAGERIAKVISRAGLASRRDAEEMVTQGRVAVNGRVINSPALDVTTRDVITVDGQKLPERERTRLFLYHKPRGLMTTHDDPEGRPTVFDNLPEGLPRLISIGRLDFNTEGLLLLTNDGGLARVLEHPDTGWLRRYRVRAHGEVTQAQLDTLKDGVEVDGVKYGPIDATLERDQGANVWVVFAIREGKNREVRNVMAHLGLEVNRLIRVSYGPFQLGEIPEGQVEEVRSRVLRDQLGEKVAALANANFAPSQGSDAQKLGRDGASLRSKKDNKERAKRSLIEDRKGRSVVVQRTGSDEARARNEDEANGYGPPRRPTRGYHGKRDLTPRD